MVKVLPTKLVTVIPATMIAMAALCTAPKAIARTTEYNGKEPTELSMGTTNAIKAMVSPQINNTQTTYNRKLHDKFLQYASGPEDIAYLNEYEKDCYKYGPYVAAALMELGIIESIFQTYLDKDTKCMDRINSEFGKRFKKYNEFHPDNEIARNKDKIMDKFYKGTDYVRNELKNSNKELAEKDVYDILYRTYKVLGLQNDDIKGVKLMCDNILKSNTLAEKMNKIVNAVYWLHIDIARAAVKPYVYNDSVFASWYNVDEPDIL